MKVEENNGEFEQLQIRVVLDEELSSKLLGSLNDYLLTLLTRWIYNLTYLLMNVYHLAIKVEKKLKGIKPF